MNIKHINVSGIRFDTRIPEKTRKAVLGEFRRLENQLENRLYPRSGEVSADIHHTFAEDRMGGGAGYLTTKPYIPYGLIVNGLGPKDVLKERKKIDSIPITIDLGLLGLLSQWNRFGAVLEMKPGALDELKKLLKDVDRQDISTTWNFTPFTVDEKGRLATNEMPHLKFIKIRKKDPILLPLDLSEDIKLSRHVHVCQIFSESTLPFKLILDTEGLAIEQAS